MNDNLTELALIVDRSGSMEPLWKDTLGGMRALITDQKAQPGEARLTLVAFDNEYLVPYRRAPLTEVNLARPRFGPRGGTALYDALGRTLVELDRQISRLPEAERPCRVIVAVFTDGQENSSQTFGGPQVLNMIRRREQEDGWTFLFLAAGREAFAEASTLGISAGHSLLVEASPAGVRRAQSALSAAVTSLRSGGEASLA